MKLKKFTEEVNKRSLVELYGYQISRSTVTLWFDKLEKENVHYVKRNKGNQKVFQEKDLEIALFILKHRRRYNISMEKIINMVRNDLNLRGLRRMMFTIKTS